MNDIRSVTVYCSSSSAIPKPYTDAAAELGAAIAHEKWALVYGGNRVGSMGVLADACRKAGGHVVGITPKLMVEKGVSDPECHELVVTDCMRERKHHLEHRGDAFITLPGGLGTYEEVFEIIVGKQLAYHNKPIVLLNISGYFEPLLAMIDHGISQKFIKPQARTVFQVSPKVSDAIEHIRSYVPPVLADKWFEKAVPATIE